MSSSSSWHISLYTVESARVQHGNSPSWNTRCPIRKTHTQERAVFTTLAISSAPWSSVRPQCQRYIYLLFLVFKTDPLTRLPLQCMSWNMVHPPPCSAMPPGISTRAVRATNKNALVATTDQHKLEYTALKMHPGVMQCTAAAATGHTTRHPPP